MKLKIKFLFIAFFIFQIILTSCHNKNNDENSLTVSAAISLKDSLEEIQLEYLQSNPNTKIIYNFGSSGSFANADRTRNVDIFISAYQKTWIL